MFNRSRRTVGGVCLAVALLVTAGPLAVTASAAPTATPVCPAAMGNARFTRWIYVQILNRCPEPAALAYWTARIPSLTRWGFAEAIDMSNENLVKNNIESGYQDLLHRAPTAAEVAHWLPIFRAMHADAMFAASGFSLEEYYMTLPGATPAAKDQAWLHAAYNAILDRNPDAAGAAHFTAQLGPGGSTVATRLSVAIQLEYSHENATGWVGAVYGAAFNRGPDAAGMQYWVNWLLGPGHWQTFRMWTHFLASNEGNARAQTQPNPQTGP